MIAAYNEGFDKRMIKDHAESLAMFQMRNEDYNKYDLYILTKTIETDLNYLIDQSD